MDGMASAEGTTLGTGLGGVLSAIFVWRGESYGHLPFPQSYWVLLTPASSNPSFNNHHLGSFY